MESTTPPPAYLHTDSGLEEPLVVETPAPGLEGTKTTTWVPGWFFDFSPLPQGHRRREGNKPGKNFRATVEMTADMHLGERENRWKHLYRSESG